VVSDWKGCRRAVRVAQVVDCLFNKHETPSSNPSTAKRKNNLSPVTTCCVALAVSFAGGVALVVECLPSKHEALSSNSSTTKK
jgi:hypothetical protein